MFDNQATVSPSLVTDMLQTISYRGPDDEGIYARGPVGLGHKRLSIIDLAGGHQPMCEESGRFWIVFNGEIYNFQELRNYLSSKGYRFQTRTDTEVIIQLYADMGVGCLEKLRGMFSFALWDKEEQSLLLARDRVGIKPLYYAVTGTALVFASEIKAILADPGIRAEVEPAIIDRFLTFYYVPGDETLFRNISKLPAGSYLLARNGRVDVRQYWDLQFAEPAKYQDPADVAARLVELLDETVNLHMISDVPIGVLLSGGVDSTAVLSFAAEKSEKNLSTFTVGFENCGIPDERPYARMAAELYGTQHHEITVGPDDFVGFLPQYIWHMEEPVCEPPAIALFYISKLAREYVKVLISGEGGDEAFAGYVNYRYNLWLEKLKALAGPLCSPISSSFSALSRLVGSKKLHKYAQRIDVPFDEYYYSLTSDPFHRFNRQSEGLYSSDFVSQISKENSLLPIRGYLADGPRQNVLSRMQYVDIKSWLPDDLLIKADRMTMANSVELRVPFLDHQLLEFAATLPTNLRVSGLTTKYILKKALKGRVPKQILERKKAGFPVPYESWFDGDLKGWLHDLLLQQSTLERGYFRKAGLQELLNGNGVYEDRGKDLFSLAILELWHRAFLDKGGPSVSSETPAVLQAQ